MKCIGKYICGHFFLSLAVDDFWHGIIGDCYHQNDKILVWPYGTMAKVQNCISFNILVRSRVQETLPIFLAWNTIIAPYRNSNGCLGVRKSCQRVKGRWVPTMAVGSWKNHSPQVPCAYIQLSQKHHILPTQCSAPAPEKEHYFLPSNHGITLI